MAHILLDGKVPHPEHPDQGLVDQPGQEPRLSQNARNNEPSHRADHTRTAPDQDLLRGVIRQVHAAPRRRGRQPKRNQAHRRPLHHRPRAMETALHPSLEHRGRTVPHEQEQRQRNAPVRDELRMGARHAVPLAVDPARPLLLDQPLEDKVERLAAELADEHEDDLGFARGEHEGRVDDDEGLREEGEVGANEGEVVVGVLF